MENIEVRARECSYKNYMSHLRFVLMLVMGWGSIAQAGTPPASCQLNGCVLTSDILVFAQGDPLYEINARITFCDFCTGQPDGSFLLYGDAEVDFGPYHASSPCTPGDETVHLALFDAHLDFGAASTYVPVNGSDVFEMDAPTPELRSGCVAPGRLDYYIPFVKLTGADGARTGDPGIGEAAQWLVLPEAVRGEDAGGLTRTVQLLVGDSRLTQNLTFTASETRSDLTLWPDGMPFKLGPYMLDYTEQQFSFTTDGASGPRPYTSAPPASPDLVPGQEISCDPSKPDFGTEPCTTQTVSNSAYFDHPNWAPAGVATITLSGMTVNLDLPGFGNSITYQPLYPVGSWVKLNGPANVSIVNGAITGGSFDGGTSWLRMNEDICAVPPRERTFQLRSGADKPQIGADGRLLAGVEDLNPSGAPIDWGVSSATALGCGSLYVPPVLPATQSPQESWAESAVPTLFDRGIYPGFNYNRDRQCQDLGGTPLAKVCVVDADCDTGSGETCQDGGFSPLCPALASVPTWNTLVEDVAKTFPIDPAVATPDSGHEMAFVTRMSGVTGVFDEGDTLFQITTPAVPSTDLGFDTFGLAYRESRSNVDTIVRGSVVFDWPANTTVPFVDMTFCDCGYMDEGHAPDVLIENTLDYWNAKFSPYAIKFSDDAVANTDCKDPHLDGDCGPSKTVILEAVTPVPRFEPDPVTCFAMDSTGDIGPFVPLSGPRVEFDRDKINLQAPYLFDLEQIELSDWAAAGSPPSAPPYGFYDLSGELGIPYFGLTQSGITVQPEVRNSVFHYPADLHQRGNPAVSYVMAERRIAAESIVLPFKVDYFSPDATADPNDGDDRAFRGRGDLFGFVEESFLDLGIAKIAGGMIMDPAGILHNTIDLGPTAALRLWGATDAAHRSQLDNIIDPGNAAPYQSQYDDILDEQKVDHGSDPWNLPEPNTLASNMQGSSGPGGNPAAGHPHDGVDYNYDSQGGGPIADGTRCRGTLPLSEDGEQVEKAVFTCDIVADMPSGCTFFKFDAARTVVDRHVEGGGGGLGEPINETRRDAERAEATGGQGMGMPVEQEIQYPEEAPPSRGPGGTEQDEAPSDVHWHRGFPEAAVGDLQVDRDRHDGPPRGPHAAAGARPQPGRIPR